MGVRAENSTNYVHSDEPNLLNLHKAMEYNAAGQPIIRTQLGGVNSPVTDAFGRLRVSSPFTLFDSFHRYQDNGKFSTYTATNGTATHNANGSSVLLSVTNENGSKVYRESTRVFAYQPGKSLQIMQTFCLGSAKANLRQRVGYFNTDNGIFLERDGTTVNLVVRSYSSGVLTENRVPQSQWNVNTLLGSSTNPTVLDFTAVQIFFIDIEWLGVGSARCGFVIDGQFVICHVFHHANVAGNTTTYMGTAVLPVRLEIENTAGTTGSSTLREICSTVVSEGGFEPTGRPRSTGTALATPRSINSSNGLVPIMSMRLKSSRLNGFVIPKTFTIAVSGNYNYEWQVILGGVTSGGVGTWTDAGASDSSVEYILDRTTITGGNIVEKGYIISSNQSVVAPSQAELFKYQLERNSFTSTASELTLCVATSASGGNGNIWASIEWQETT
jgi:hypothetical protein